MIDDKIRIRKKEHISGFLKGVGGKENGFEDVVLFNNSIPELNFKDISLETTFMSKKISAPLMINAITGGTEEAEAINKDLAYIAKELNIPMAVGSQSIALKFSDAVKSFMCVREIMGDEGVVIANLSANKSVEEVKKAIDMINADGIQLHLNVPQEMCMEEGDRDFKGVINNISNIKESIEKPIIIKEVGFGISYETAIKLKKIGVKYIDIGGKGGTNFIEIEDLRYESSKYSEFYSWGIPTAHSLLITLNAYRACNVICSGGINKGEDVIKSLILGADIVGVSGVVLRWLLEEGKECALEELKQLINNIKIYMMLLGKGTIRELKDTPYMVKGELKEVEEYIMKTYCENLK
ncbi:type 2 isopentenyl-diphosphate Delta-isomerase [Oceanirhabdus sp. W0125-5]|uniref:type 2 isopentenyl-diphosphate Delta-isomerase n=1 Tax=Oceanirhabdus sp. W0125-5 TaxID=2999116 RepID=UPI0022F3260A|nr:type 2 isopentenyl-diphosphate Delta-isomerase [Oceanirhabdus sp. W0125-5]WBW98198.1 type 2 isopentenyl-diphosphate Delta-isomerase [Oceanirhabdus sp. W0125-5]